MSLLMFACKKTTTPLVRTLLRFPTLQPYHRDQNGRNAVHYAIENPDEEHSRTIVQELVQQYPRLVHQMIARKRWGIILKVTTLRWRSERVKVSCLSV